MRATRFVLGEKNGALQEENNNASIINCCVRRKHIKLLISDHCCHTEMAVISGLISFEEEKLNRSNSED